MNYKRTLCQNAALPLNGTFHQQNVGRFVGPQAAQTRPGWATLMRGRSFLGQSSRYLAMITWPVLTKLFKACAMIVVLIPCYDILMSSRTRHKSASNRHELNYWLTYTMADTYLMMVLQQWGKSSWNLGEIKKTYQVWNLENVNRKLTMEFKLDLKNITLTTFRPPG